MGKHSDEEGNQVNSVAYSEKLKSIPEGICFYPNVINSGVGTTYCPHLIMDHRKIHQGDIINIICDNPKVCVGPTQIIINKNYERVIIKNLRVFSSDIGETARIVAEVANSNGTKPISAELKVTIVDENIHKEELKIYGLYLQPQNMTLKPGQTKRFDLLIDARRVPDGAEIHVVSDNPDAFEIHRIPIDASDESECSLPFVFSHNDTIKKIGHYRFELTGTGEGQETYIQASAPGYPEIENCLGAKVQTKEEEDEAKYRGKSGSFDMPEYHDEPDPNEDGSYSPETGKIRIYLNFPSNRIYYGDHCEKTQSVAARIKTAELLCKHGLGALARKHIGNAKEIDQIEREYNILLKKYGEKIHRIFVKEIFQ
jgi:TusA-related sulfurtransferase